MEKKERTVKFNFELTEEALFNLEFFARKKGLSKNEAINAILSRFQYLPLVKEGEEIRDKR